MQKTHKIIQKDTIHKSLSRINQIENRKSGIKTNDIACYIRSTMQKYCGVFRTLKTLKEGIKKIEEITQLSKNVFFLDKSKVFNTARIESIELLNLIEVARATIHSAANRKESRGAHALNDFPKRDDKNWCKHTLWYSDEGRLDYKPVQMNPLTVRSFTPQNRTF